MMTSDTFDTDANTTGIEEDRRAEQQALQPQGKPFVSLLELIAEVYQVKILFAKAADLSFMCLDRNL